MATAPPTDHDTERLRSHVRERLRIAGHAGLMIHVSRDLARAAEIVDAARMRAAGVHIETSRAWVEAAQWLTIAMEKTAASMNTLRVVGAQDKTKESSRPQPPRAATT